MGRNRQAILALASVIGMSAAESPVSAAQLENTPVNAPDAPSMLWVRRPTGEEIARYYPVRALQAGASGSALIHCKVTAEGLLGGCVVLGEAPPDMGFGKAVLDLSRFFKVKPDPKETRPIEGAVLNIPIRFSINGAESPELNLNNGWRAMLVTKAEPPTPAQNQFDCPSPSDPKRRCQAHLVFALQPIYFITATEILTRAGVDSGTSVLQCVAGADGSLHECSLGSPPNPDAAAAASEWAARLRVRPKAEDGTATAGGRILLEIDWAAAKRLRDRLKP